MLKQNNMYCEIAANASKKVKDPWEALLKKRGRRKVLFLFSWFLLLLFFAFQSASSLQMLLYSLATNVDKQEKLAAQITEVLGPEGKIKPNMLESMDYLNAVVKESLRWVLTSKLEGLH